MSEVLYLIFKHLKEIKEFESPYAIVKSYIDEMDVCDSIFDILKRKDYIFKEHEDVIMGAYLVFKKYLELQEIVAYTKEVPNSKIQEYCYVSSFFYAYSYEIIYNEVEDTETANSIIDIFEEINFHLNAIRLEEDQLDICISRRKFLLEFYFLLRLFFSETNILSYEYNFIYLYMKRNGCAEIPGVILKKMLSEPVNFGEVQHNKDLETFLRNNENVNEIYIQIFTK